MLFLPKSRETGMLMSNCFQCFSPGKAENQVQQNRLDGPSLGGVREVGEPGQGDQESRPGPREIHASNAVSRVGSTEPGTSGVADVGLSLGIKESAR